MPNLVIKIYIGSDQAMHLVVLIITQSPSCYNKVPRCCNELAIGLAVNYRLHPYTVHCHVFAKRLPLRLVRAGPEMMKHPAGHRLKLIVKNPPRWGLLLEDAKGVGRQGAGGRKQGMPKREGNGWWPVSGESNFDEQF